MFDLIVNSPGVGVIPVCVFVWSLQRVDDNMVKVIEELILVTCLMLHVTSLWVT